jgi:hypothetical protein
MKLDYFPYTCNGRAHVIVLNGKNGFVGFDSFSLTGLNFIRHFPTLKGVGKKA